MAVCGTTIIQVAVGLILQQMIPVARTILPKHIKDRKSGNVTTALTEENGTDVLTDATGGGGGVADGNTTYTLTGEDGDDANSKKIRLRDSTDAIQDNRLGCWHKCRYHKKSQINIP